MLNKTQQKAFRGKSWQLLIFTLILYGSSFGQGFPGTDSLRNYNTRYITNNPNTAFTNLRLHTLLRGVIDWVDTARISGGGGGGSLGVDTIYAINDSTIRYRKSGVFRNVVIKGVYDSRRKVDTMYQVNDTTIGFRVNGIQRTFVYRGQPRTERINDSTIVIGLDTLEIKGSGNDPTKVPLSRTITINGNTQDLSTDRTWTLTKSDIGLGNVDNTSDLNKPVSIAQQAALNLKIDSVKRRVDSVFIYKNGTEVFAFIDSGQAYTNGYGLLLTGNEFKVDSTKQATLRAIQDSVALTLNNFSLISRIEFLQGVTGSSTYQNDTLINKNITSLEIQSYSVGFMPRSNSVYISGFDSSTGTITLANGVFDTGDFVRILFRSPPIFLLGPDGWPLKDITGQYIILN